MGLVFFDVVRACQPPAVVVRSSGVMLEGVIIGSNVQEAHVLKNKPGTV